MQSTIPCKERSGGAKITNDCVDEYPRQGVTRSTFVDAIRKAFLDVSSSPPSCEVQAAFDSINNIMGVYT